MRWRFLHNADDPVGKAQLFALVPQSEIYKEIGAVFAVLFKADHVFAASRDVKQVAFCKACALAARVFDRDGAAANVHESLLRSWCADEVPACAGLPFLQNAADVAEYMLDTDVCVVDDPHRSSPSLQKAFFLF